MQQKIKGTEEQEHSRRRLKLAANSGQEQQRGLLTDVTQQKQCLTFGAFYYYGNRSK